MSSEHRWEIKLNSQNSPTCLFSLHTISYDTSNASTYIIWYARLLMRNRADLTKCWHRVRFRNIWGWTFTAFFEWYWCAMRWFTKWLDLMRCHLTLRLAFKRTDGDVTTFWLFFFNSSFLLIINHRKTLTPAQSVSWKPTDRTDETLPKMLKETWWTGCKCLRTINAPFL